MPRKIENPLISGIPAKIYMLCYLNNETGYSLAKKIYNITSGIPPTARIYPWTKIMVEQKLLKKVNKTFRSQPEPLANQIIEILKNNTINFKEPEKKILKRILNSDNFRDYVKMGYERFEPHYNIDFGEESVTHTNEFNALEFISESIGKIATLCLIQKRFGIKVFSEDEEVTGQYVKSMGGQYKIDEKKLQEGIIAFRNIAKEAILFKENVLGKLSILWQDSRSIIYSHYVDYHSKHRKDKK
jgi:hypothetical protein